MSIESTVDTIGQETAGKSPQEKSLFSPLIDFLCLGGGFLIFVLPIFFFIPKDNETVGTISLITIIAAIFITHPHVIHSYFIFYRDFRFKTFSKEYPLRKKYIFAGIILPLIMIIGFSYCILAQNYIPLGYTANLMGFLILWHFAKQGYGMLMVSAALKRSFFTGPEKRILLLNTHFVWLFSWVLINDTIHEKTLWGIEYFTFALPAWALWLTATPMVISTIFVASLFIKRCLSNYASFPKNGAMSYLTSLYVWLIVVHLHPALILTVPIFHSIQYFVVVWRYEINKSNTDYKAELEKNTHPTVSVKRRLINIGAATLVFGIIGYWVIPIALDFFISYEIENLPNTAFIFMFVIFYNIHHYFIDNVIWKKENTDIAKYLFNS